METSIQVSNELLDKLRLMKIHDKESYENIIWDLIEDRMEFSGQTQKNIAISEKEIREGKTIKLEDIKTSKTKVFDSSKTESFGSAQNPQESQILDGSQSSKTLKSKEFRHAQKSYNKKISDKRAKN